MARDSFNQFFEQFSSRLQQFDPIPDSVKQSIQSAMRGTFDKLDLVPREEFDIMQGVLQRTRTRLEALERQLDVLERKVAAQNSHQDDDNGKLDESSVDA